MAQSGYTPIQLYRTTTAAAVPLAADLAQGELAINIANGDMALFAENASGTVTRLMNNPAGLKYPTADGTANQLVKTDGAGVLSFVAAAAAGFTLGTPVASTSGTSITFTGIPAGTKQIIMNFSIVVIAAQMIVQLGDSGGIENTNYVSAGVVLSSGDTAQTNNATDGFLPNETSSKAYSGSITFTLLDAATFLWVASGTIGSVATGKPTAVVSGKKALSAELTQIRLTSSAGVASFSAGSVNIAYI